jgi:hypothetical protein
MMDERTVAQEAPSAACRERPHAAPEEGSSAG